MTQRICDHCGSSAFRRLNRQGWWQRVMLSRLGFYPWECANCRKRVFFRDTGAPQERDSKAPAA